MADNLLDKASILLTPTAYDNGSMLSIKPENGDGDFDFERNSAATRVNAQGLVENVQIISPELVSNGNFSQIGTEEVLNGNFSQEGSELVTNGDFSVDSNWNKGTGWSISGGKASCDGSQTSNSLFFQNIGSLANKTVKFSFTLSNYVSGQINTAFFSASGTTSYVASANGDYTFYIDVASGHNGNTGFTANSDFIGSIDNVSIKEVAQNWTLGSGWSVDQDNSKAICDGTQTSTSTLQSARISNIQNDLVKLSFEIKDYSAGAVSVTLEGTGGIEFNNLAANGVYEINVASTDSLPRLLFNANSSFETLGWGLLKATVIKSINIPARKNRIFDHMNGSTLPTIILLVE